MSNSNGPDKRGATSPALARWQGQVEKSIEYLEEEVRGCQKRAEEFMPREVHTLYVNEQERIAQALVERADAIRESLGETVGETTKRLEASIDELKEGQGKHLTVASYNQAMMAWTEWRETVEARLTKEAGTRSGEAVAAKRSATLIALIVAGSGTAVAIIAVIANILTSR